MRTVEISVEDWVKIVEQGYAVVVTIFLQGSSMEPLIRNEKDSITIIPRKHKKLQVGDVVLFRRAMNDYVVHRIYKVEGGMVQTWGDNCRFPDAPIADNAVIGIVDSVNKNGKKIRLTTEKQRQEGIKWMNSKVRKKIWKEYWGICNIIKKLLRRMKMSIS